MAGTPLENIDNALIPRLGQVLWSWTPCAACLSGQACISSACPCRRSSRLERYLQYYKAAVSTYVDAAANSARLLKSHEDLFCTIAQLKSHPDATKSEFYQIAFLQNDGETPHDPEDLLQATSLAVKVLLMIESSALHHLSDRVEKGTFRIYWKDNVPLSQYLRDLFPIENHTVLSYADSERFLDVKSELRATKLKKELGLSFRPTHDIRNHLCFDRKENVLEIFHHTAFLKEHLRATKGGRDFSYPSASIRVGSLPRQLALEVLDSIQGVLFPLSDPRSKRLLRSLVKSCSLDPDILNFEFSSIRNPGEENIAYVVLANKLSDLHNEMRNPPPRGRLERLVERRSGARYMMMATLIGVVFAVLLGMLSLAVSSYQTWIAYQAWQHPVSPNS